MTPWHEIYRERMNDRYIRHIKKKYGTFIRTIAETPTFHYPSYVELGCGAGNITKVLREQKPASTCTLIDLCPDMLSLAIKNNQSQNCKFIVGDITQLSYNASPRYHPDNVVHSHGVLEHLEDDQIIDILHCGYRIGARQIHYVPGAKYEVPSRGDERLLTPQKWRSILRNYTAYEAGRVSTKVSTFNDGYDIIIQVKREE